MEELKAAVEKADGRKQEPTMRECFRAMGWDFFHHATREDAAPFAAAQREVTGREVACFEEEMTCGQRSYTVFYVAVSPRPRPVVRLVTA